MPNAPKYQQYSDYANTDIDSGERDNYGAQNRAGRSAHQQLHIQDVMVVHPDGTRTPKKLFSLSRIADTWELYHEDAKQPRVPVDQSEIVYPPGAFQCEDGRWAAHLEMQLATHALTAEVAA